MMKSLKIIAVALMLLLSACDGGKGGNQPAPPTPTPNPTPDKLPDWNKSRTIGLLFVGKLDGKALFTDASQYVQLAEKIKSLPAKTFSWAYIDGTDGVSPTALEANLNGYFAHFNLQNYENGVAEGATVLVKGWQKGGYTNTPLVSQRFMLQMPITFSGISEAAPQYDINVVALELNSQQTIDKWGESLSALTSVRHPHFVVGTVDRSLKAALETKVSAISTYKLTFPSLETNGSQLLFIYAQKSFLLRETKQLFDLPGGAKGYLLSIESGVHY